MGHFSRALATVDSSKPALRAFEYALALSARDGSELFVVHVVPPGQSAESLVRERRALREEFRRRAALANIEFTDAVRQGDPAEVILAQAGSLAADLIVVGTHQRTAMSRFRSRSVAERVAAKATVPVLVVPGRRHTVAIAPFRHIAVAVDFRQGSTRTIEEAARLASHPSEDLTLLHVVPRLASESPADSYSLGIGACQDQLLRDDQEQLIQNARRRLRHAAPKQLLPPTAVHTRVLLGDTTAALGGVLDNIGADLLVVGIRKRGAVWRALFAMTAARLIGVIDVPLLAVPDVPRTIDRRRAPLRQVAA